MRAASPDSSSRRPIVNPLTGELMAEEGQVVSRELAKEIDDAGVSVAYVTVNEREVKVISNGMVDIQKILWILMQLRSAASTSEYVSACSTEILERERRRRGSAQGRESDSRQCGRA